MAAAKQCFACQKQLGIMYCAGCNESFCSKDMRVHREGMFVKMDRIVEERNRLQDEINNGVQVNDQQNPVLKQIDGWEKSTIGKVKHVAAQARQQTVELLGAKQMKINIEFKSFSHELADLKESENYVEHDLERLNQKISQFQQDLKNLAQPTAIILHTEQSDGINWESLIYVEEKQATTTKKPQVPTAPPKK